ncbi:MAG: glycosyltransferase family 4 protein [Chloroflexota bacterium]|nr:glycosyltransferase family 4 protein [Chloroflexota bacterium]
MRICLLCNRGNMFCGGQGVYLYYLSRELRRLGHEVHTIVGPPYPDVADGVIEHRVDNLNMFEYGFPKHDPFKIFTPLNMYEVAVTRVGKFPEMFSFSFRSFEKLRRIMREYKFDIIHDNQTLGYGNILMKGLGVPVVATIHHPLPIDKKTDMPYIHGIEHRLRRILFYPFFMQHLTASTMDRVITVSDNAAKEIRNSFKVSHRKMRVVYNGIDTEAFRPIEGVQKEPNRIIVVANTSDRKKGVLYLLRAMRQLRQEMDIKLTIVDRGLPDNEYTPALVERCGLNGSAEFTGRVTTEELAMHYNRAAVAVVPSLYEGFGLPAAEAMSCGLPVISTTAGALPEVVADGESGILVPPGDHEAIAAALRRLLSDDDLRRDMGRAGRDRVERMFNWEEAAKKTLEVYQEVL